VGEWTYKVKAHIPMLFMGWLPTMLVGIGLAGRVEWLRIALLLAGTYVAMRFQHAYHVFRGKSTTPGMTVEQARAETAVWAIGGLVVASVIAYLEPKTVLLVAAIVVCLVAYSHLHREEVTGCGFALYALYVYEVLGEVSIGGWIFCWGWGCVYFVGILAYRLATGDYDVAPPGFHRRLHSIFGGVVLASILFALAFTVGI